MVERRMAFEAFLPEFSGKSGSESEKDQRINGKHRRKFSCRIRFRSVWIQFKWCI